MEIRQQKELKDSQIGKEEVNLSLFAEGMTLYVENPKTPPKTTGTDKFSKVSATDRQQQTEFVAFLLYTNNEREKRGIKKATLFTIAPKINYLGINLRGEKPIL